MLPLKICLFKSSCSTSLSLFTLLVPWVPHVHLKSLVPLFEKLVSPAQMSPGWQEVPSAIVKSTLKTI